jgi:hypothetical protein
VSDKTGWEGRDQSRGTQVGAHGALSRALGPAKENNYALEPLDGYIVQGCSGAKTEIPVKIGLRLKSFKEVSCPRESE